MTKVSAQQPHLTFCKYEKEPNLYRILANNLPEFEHYTAATINRKFLETGARIKINGNQIMVHLKKKTHLPILFEVPWVRQNNQLSWTGTKIRYVQGTVS